MHQIHPDDVLQAFRARLGMPSHAVKYAHTWIANDASWLIAVEPRGMRFVNAWVPDDPRFSTLGIRFVRYPTGKTRNNCLPRELQDCRSVLKLEISSHPQVERLLDVVRA